MRFEKATTFSGAGVYLRNRQPRRPGAGAGTP
jgi:hypothetical protein